MEKQIVDLIGIIAKQNMEISTKDRVINELKQKLEQKLTVDTPSKKLQVRHALLLASSSFAQRSEKTRRLSKEATK